MKGLDSLDWVVITAYFVILLGVAWWVIKQKQKNTIKALRTPAQIREEMRQLKALRPDHCRTTQDWIALQRFQELYAEWIESVVVSSDHKKDQS